MPGGVYVGRRRPIWQVVLFQLLTLGIYGRVWLYRTARELDGHDALFLDLRLFALGVVLPMGGPLIVKWRLVSLVRDATRHDPTAPRMHLAGLRTAAFLPYLPLVHALLQRHLKHHWTLHSKLDDLGARAEVLSARRDAAKSKEELEEVRRLEEDLQQRQSVLAQAREAAVSIREAERARARAEEEIRAAGGAPSRAQRLKAMAQKTLKRRPGDVPDAASPEDVHEIPPESTVPEAPRPRMGRKPKPAPPPEPRPAEDTLAAPSNPTATGVAPAEPSVVPSPEDPLLSKKERKALAALAKARGAREAAETKARTKRDVKAAKAAAKEGREAPAPEPAIPGAPSKKEVKFLAKYENARSKREAKAARKAEKAAANEAAKAGAPSDVPPGALVGAEPPTTRKRFGFARKPSAPADESIAPRAAPEPERKRLGFFGRRAAEPSSEPPPAVASEPTPEPSQSEPAAPVAEPEPTGRPAPRKRPKASGPKRTRR